VVISIKGNNLFLYIFLGAYILNNSYVYTCSLKIRLSNGRTAEVCPVAFAKVHCRGHTYYDNMVSELKQGAQNGSVSMFQHHSALTPSQVKHLQKTGCNFGMKLSNSEFTAATIPSTILALHTASWMQEFFRLTGVHRVLIEKISDFHVINKLLYCCFM
jgi:hypothetical protein